MNTKMQTYPFLKMHGLGNDFAIFDARAQTIEITEANARRLCDRRRGIGCDQLIVLRTSNSADVFMEIWNADGSQAGACGNATRCVGQLLLSETDQASIKIETIAGMLTAEAKDNLISVNMGPANLEWHKIPLASAMPTDTLDYAKGPLSAPGCVNMGNPHVIFFVENTETVDLERWGPEIETDPLFPEKANVSIVSVKDGNIRQRVWERGAGITEACGSGACAALVAASRRGLTGRSATVTLDGGNLFIEWLDNGTVQMTGPATTSYFGEVSV